MSRISPVDHAAASGRQQELLDAVKASLGATPNMTRTMARSAVLEAWLGFSGALRKGSIGTADASGSRSGSARPTAARTASPPTAT